MTREEYIARSLVSMESFVDMTFKAKAQRDFVWGEHHRIICRALDDVVDGKIRKLIINIAPRYGKTELVSKMFVAYGLALNPRSRFITLSYSEDLVLDNSNDINEFVRSSAYQYLYPHVQVADRAAKKWYTSKGGGVYAVSTAGQVTGFGAGQMDEDTEEWLNIPESEKFSGAIIIDDPIKPVDADSDVEREKINARYTTTISSRTNSSRTPIIIVAQRLHEHDFCAYVQEAEPGEWTVISLPCIAVDGDGKPKALWSFKHTLEDLEKLRNSDPITFDTQYMQNPTPKEGLMYSTFRTYDTLPVGECRILNYTDTADKGTDYLCSICYAQFKDAIYVIDVLYTQKPMEFTEPETARMLTRNSVEKAFIESNNGGRGFSRNVERACRELKNIDTQFEPFTQTENKDSRIFSHSAKAVNIIFMPTGWDVLWKEFADAIKSYRKAGKNAHDDAPDALTGCVEKYEEMNQIGTYSIKFSTRNGRHR